MALYQNLSAHYPVMLEVVRKESSTPATGAGKILQEFIDKRAPKPNLF
jgi:hypothetical protein